MNKNQKVLTIQSIGFILMGLLLARLYFSEKDLVESIFEFDTVMIILLIVGIFMMALGLKRFQSKKF